MTRYTVYIKQLLKNQNSLYDTSPTSEMRLVSEE